VVAKIDQPATTTVQNGTVTRQAIRTLRAQIASATSYRSSSNPSLLSMLSVMILTLAFFVLLNSISRVEPDRSKRVLQSIDQTFGTLRGANLLLTSDGAASSDVAFVLRQIFEPMENLAPDVARVRRVMAESLEFRFPTAWLFPGPGATLSPTAGNFISETKRLLNILPADWGHELEMALTAPEPSDVDFARAASLATALASGNAPDRMNSVSVAPGQVEEIAILITLLRPGSAIQAEAASR